MQGNAVIAQGRINLAIETLYATGWVRTTSGFSPPTHIKERLEEEAGMQHAGSWPLDRAMMLQLQYDNAVVAATKKLVA